MDKKEVDTEGKIIDFIPSKIILKQSFIHGIGVFAAQDIMTDEIIERCPLIPLAFRSRYHTDPQIYRYLYTQPLCPCQECQKRTFVHYYEIDYN